MAEHPAPHHEPADADLLEVRLRHDRVGVAVGQLAAQLALAAAEAACEAEARGCPRALERGEGRSTR
jgi:hypothetical protein